MKLSQELWLRAPKLRADADAPPTEELKDDPGPGYPDSTMDCIKADLDRLRLDGKEEFWP